MVELDTLQEDAETEAEEQKLARIRHLRAQRVLRDAPGLIMYVRSLIDHTERGEVLAEYASPMRLTATDDADAFYAQLVDWVMFWAEQLEVNPPTTAAVASRNFQRAHRSTGFTDGKVQGFRAGTAPEGAHMLVRLLTMWLLTHAERICEFPAAGEYETDVTGLLWALRGRYPTAPRRERDVFPRPCPVCDTHAVGAEWFSADVRDVVVSCGECAYEIPVKDVNRFLGMHFEAKHPGECARCGQAFLTGDLVRDVGELIEHVKCDAPAIVPGPARVSKRIYGGGYVDGDDNLLALERPGVTCPVCFLVKPCGCD